MLSLSLTSHDGEMNINRKAKLKKKIVVESKLVDVIWSWSNWRLKGPLVLGRNMV